MTSKPKRDGRWRPYALSAILVGIALATPTPADAAPSDGVTVQTPANGDLIVTGDDGDNTVWVHGNGAGYAIWVEKGNGQVAVHNVGPITGNARFDMGGGDDKLRIGSYGPVLFPTNVVTSGGDGDDSLSVKNATIGESLILRPDSTDGDGFDSFVVADTAIGGDLDFKPGNTESYLAIIDSTVGRRALFNGTVSSERLRVVINGLHADQLSAFGGPGDDFMILQRTDLGDKPVVNLADGENELRLFGSNTWTGTFTFAVGSGNDRFWALDGASGSVAALPTVDLRMGGGDDDIILRSGLSEGGPGSYIRGQGGIDWLETNGSFQETTIISVQHVS